MISLAHLLLAIAAAQSTGVIRQSTTGWCSPTIANVIGNVTVTCIGVDPRALKCLNAQLSKKNQELAAKIGEANEWVERYRELEASLKTSGSNSKLSLQAEEYLRQGELEKAKDILDSILKEDEHEEDRIASDHYNRGLIAELQFQPLDALPHYETAYRYRPDNPKYGDKYASLLTTEHEYAKAEAVLSATVERARELAKKDKQYDPGVAWILYSQANLFLEIQRFQAAEENYKESLSIFRELAKSDPSKYSMNVAYALNDLGILYQRTRRFDLSEASYREAISIERSLPDDARYRIFLAQSLNNLATVYTVTRRPDDALKAYEEAVSTLRDLVKKNPAAYEHDLAIALNSMAVGYQVTRRLKEAEQTAQESLEIQTRLASANPAAYLFDEAWVLTTLGNIYDAESKHEEAQASFDKAIKIYRDLIKNEPNAYQSRFANTLSQSALDFEQTGKTKEAAERYEEALTIQRQLAKTDFNAFGKQAAATSSALGKLYFKSGNLPVAESLLREAIESYRQLGGYDAEVAGNLEPLSFVYVQQRDFVRAQKAAEEAVGIYSKLASTEPSLYGDPLARCLLVNAATLERQNPSAACSMVSQAAGSAFSPDMKKIVQSASQKCSQKRSFGRAQ